MHIAILNKYQNKVNRGAETFVSEIAKRLSANNKVGVISNINYLDLFKNKYDIVIPTNGRWQAAMVRIVTWLNGSKMIISGQSGPGLDDRINLYSFPDAFIGLTKFQTDWARRINPFVKVVNIPNGVDLSTFKGEPLQGMKNGQKVILSVGAFTKDKRHYLTIHAVSKLNNVKLKIVGGGGELRDEIFDLGIKILGKERFEVLSVPHGKMPDVYRSSGVLVFPTVPWESFGIAMVEAMATGLPVVASDDPIRREIVGEAGLFVDPTNIDEYAKALKKALDTDWGNKPRKQAEKFSWDGIAKQYESLFKTLINKK